MPKTVEQLKAEARSLRELIKRLGDQVLAIKTGLKETADRGIIPANPPIDFGEAIAVTVLAYRHLEDARMRLGKTIQALDGGVSIYDRDPPAQQQQ